MTRELIYLTKTKKYFHSAAYKSFNKWIEYNLKRNLLIRTVNINLCTIKSSSFSLWEDYVSMYWEVIYKIIYYHNFKVIFYYKNSKYM